MSATELAPNFYARAERNALADLLLEIGADGPTLCEGWTTRDLAGHLVIREGLNPIASFGIFVPPLNGASEKARVKAGNQPWASVVDKIRSGPPKGSMMRPAKLDGAINTIEYFVHHEDIRRAQPDWQPRDLGPELTEDLWTRLPQFAKRLTGKAGCGVVVQHTDGRRIDVKEGTHTVTVTGDPGELVMFLFGRSAANVTLEGDTGAVDHLREAVKGH